MNDDRTLLRRYADEGSETAFTELVRRHVDLVYAAAMRRTNGDSHRAADVAQQVFTTLAREAGKLSQHAVLVAWLHTATRNAALNLMISDQRRKARELAAVELDSAMALDDPNPAWERLRPVLDAAIDELSETDRAAVILRFLDRRPFAEIGATLAVSEDAARMRTERALEKLRALLERRGISSTAAALGSIVASHPAVSAPAGLAASVAAQSLAAVSVTAVGLIGAALTSLMNTKLITACALSSIAAFGLGAYVTFIHTSAEPLPPPIETPRHSQLIVSLRQTNESLRAEVDRLNAANAKLAAQRSAPASAAAAASKPALDGGAMNQQQRAVLNNLRQIAAARDQFQIEKGRPPSSIDELVGEQNYIKRLISVDGENYAGLSLLPGQPLVVTTATAGVVTYDPPPPTPPAAPSPAQMRAAALRSKILPALRQASAAYAAANNGAKVPTAEALIPYFSTPQEGADFVEMLEAQKEAQR